MSSPSHTTHPTSPSEAKPWVKPLVGHSGCGLTLHKHQETGHFFVRKTAASVAYNKRLQRQCSKQRRFYRPPVATPAVLGYGHEPHSGLFYFDMAFVRCQTLAECLGSLKIKRIHQLIQLLFTALPVQHVAPKATAHSVFTRKLAQLRQALPHPTPPPWRPRPLAC